MSLKSYIKSLAKSNNQINPSIFLFLKIIDDYSKKYDLTHFSIKEFQHIQNRFLNLIKNNNRPNDIIHEIISTKKNYKKGGAFERLANSNEEIVETQYEALKKIFVYTMVLTSLNLFNENEIGYHLLPFYTIICVSFILQVLFNTGYFIEGIIIIFGRKFGLFRNVANPETITLAFSEPTILAELHQPDNIYLEQLKENALAIVFQGQGLPVAQIHFPWHEFVLAENLDDLFNVEDNEEDDLPYLLEPRGGARKKSKTTKSIVKKRKTKKIRRKNH
jgi:hypothetical protein